ncbi:hypothetical protein TSAR_004472 [Trichomalopsis sarcophagae]|uniref:Uncharacterized protein n=1 Tax=Trichomalopsis sarcophagae TaxID=543379 RepID=A0A232ET01_9HYME|nr:hypothetical protein TSAR_004472 [Trichomalopsis sarcophagae]
MKKHNYKQVSQKQNSQRIIQTYKNQVLMNSRLELVIEDESNSNDTLNNANLDCSIPLTDFLKDYS